MGAMNLAVESGQRSLVRASNRHPLAVEHLEFAGEGYLGKEPRRKECLQLDHSQEGVLCDSMFGGS